MEKLGYYHFGVAESSKMEKRLGRRSLIAQALRNSGELKHILYLVRFWEITYYQNGLLYK